MRTTSVPLQRTLAVASAMPVLSFAGPGSVADPFGEWSGNDGAHHACEATVDCWPWQSSRYLPFSVVMCAEAVDPVFITGLIVIWRAFCVQHPPTMRGLCQGESPASVSTDKNRCTFVASFGGSADEIGV